MRTLYKQIGLLCLLLAASCLTGCMDDDERVAYRVSGHWYGYLGMSWNGERAQVSEIEFDNSGWNRPYGRGVQIDYYYSHAITNRFSWEVRQGAIYLTFDTDPALDCVIDRYEFGYDNSYFRGDMYDLDGYFITEFRLRNYDTDYDDSVYGRYSYYVKGQGAARFSPTRAADGETLPEGKQERRVVP